MSRLILKGNIVNNFGKFLPAPFIEKVYIEDEDIRVRIALYIMIADDEDQDEFTAQSALEELTYYVVITTASGDRTAEALESGKLPALGLIRSAHDYAGFSSLSQWRRAYEGIGLAWEDTVTSGELEEFEDSGAQNLYEMDYTGWATYPEKTYHGKCPDCTSTYESFSFDDFNFVGVRYDSAGRKMLKYTVETTADAFGILSSSEYYFAEYEDWVNMTVYTFSSTMDYDDENGDQDTIEDMFVAGKSNGVLAHQYTSDISHEILFKGSEIAGQANMAWTTADGGIYDGIPLETVMSKYYNTDGITHEEITDSFNELVEEYTTEAETDSGLESALDGLSYVLAVYGIKSELLPRLNELRKAWPSKSSVTTVGKVYGRLKNKIAAANAAVRKGLPLKKILVFNPKIVDFRDPVTDDWEQNEVETATVNEYLYNEWYITSQTYATGEETEEWPQGVTGGIVTNGYYFIDLEKAIHKVSNIAKIYDVAKLETYFGKEITSSRFKAIQAHFFRHLMEESASSSDLELAHKLSAEYGSGTNASVVTISNEVDRVAGTGALISDEDASDGTTKYSFIRTRNFEFASVDQDPTYRLLCCEFQVLYENPYTTANMRYLESATWENLLEGQNSFYTWLTIKDNTHKIITALTDNYSSIIDSYAEYVLLAQEACSYNNTDGVFNDFFIENITAAYEDNIGEAPWIVAPLLWNIHRDLLFDTHGGDYDQVLEKSKNMSDRISPYGGNLEMVESFQETLQGLYSAYYDSGGAIEIVLNGGDSDTDGTTSGLDSTEVTFLGTYDDPVYLYDAGHEFVEEEVEVEEEYTPVYLTYLDLGHTLYSQTYIATDRVTFTEMVEMMSSAWDIIMEHKTDTDKPSTILNNIFYKNDLYLMGGLGINTSELLSTFYSYGEEASITRDDSDVVLDILEPAVEAINININIDGGSYYNSWQRLLEDDTSATLEPAFYFFLSNMYGTGFLLQDEEDEYGYGTSANLFEVLAVVNQNADDPYDESTLYKNQLDSSGKDWPWLISDE